MPLAWESVYVPVEVLFNVTKFPDVPDTLKFVNVLVDPAVNWKVVGWTPFAMPVNVLLPLIISVPAPSLDSVQLNVEPPPIKDLAVALDILIFPVPVPAVVVNPVGAEFSNPAIVLPPATTKVPPLNVRFFVPVAVTKKFTVIV
jgi:hypothetical protein